MNESMGVDDKVVVTEENLEDLSFRAADQFCRFFSSVSQPCSPFTIALSGGETPRAFYRQLVSPAFIHRIDWERVHFFWGDERYVPKDDPQSNFGLAKKSFLDELLKRGKILDDQIHRVKTELGTQHDPWPVARDYENEIRKIKPEFDFALLGVGEDGHTASLFPDGSPLSDGDHLVVAPWVKHLNAFRISLTADVFNHALCVMFFVSGKSKAKIVHDIFDADEAHQILFPSQRIKPIHAPAFWFLDREAAELLAS